MKKIILKLFFLTLILFNLMTPVYALSGRIKIWTSAAIPSGYLLCDGKAVSRTTYANLYKIIGTAYGAGDGSTTFNLPNLTERVAIGKGNNKPIGSTGGQNTITITTANLPNHTHSYTPTGTVASTFKGTQGTTSNSGSHNHNMMLKYETGYNLAYSSGGAYWGMHDPTEAVNNSFKTTASGAHTHTITTKGTVSSTFTGSPTTTTAVGAGSAVNIKNAYTTVNYIIKY